MPKFRIKPVVIDAVQWTGENKQEISTFCGSHHRFMPGGGSLGILTLEGDMTASEGDYIIHEGDMTASEGDYIIQGIKGEFYPCKPDIFEMTYEKTD